MDRREFLRATAAAAAATTATAAAAETAEIASTPPPQTADVASPAVAMDIRELRLAVAWPDVAAGPPDQAHRLAARITAMSGGRYRVALVPGVSDGLAAVRSGLADAYFASENDHLEAHRALAYFAGLPGTHAIAPNHHVAWMLTGGGQELWDGLAGGFGIKAMLAGHAGAGCFVASRNITAMHELAGAKVSVAGLARDVARGFGLDPVSAAPADLPALLASGELLAAEHGGAIASHALGLIAAAPFAVGTGINRHGTALALGLRRSLWDGMSAADQAVFAAAAAAELQLALAEDESHRRLLWPQTTADRSWTVAPELERTIARVSDAVVAHVAATDARARHIGASYSAFRHVALGDTRAAPTA
jgi:TRAP-type mannitol/chloroaromatic compound transport system substrate-binding protein